MKRLCHAYEAKRCKPITGWNCPEWRSLLARPCQALSGSSIFRHDNCLSNQPIFGRISRNLLLIDIDPTSAFFGGLSRSDPGIVDILRNEARRCRTERDNSSLIAQAGRKTCFGGL